jgi:zinc transport system substrate-binding protein
MKSLIIGRSYKVATSIENKNPYGFKQGRFCMAPFSLKTIIIVLLSLLIQNNVFAKDPLQVFVSIVPQKYFVEQIGKDLVEVQVMVQPGASPHTYEPRPLQMTELSKAGIYFAIGVTFENAWLNKISSSNPNLMIVHTEKNIQKIPMAAHHHNDNGHKHGENNHHGEEAHGKEPDHDHHHHDGILDPHIWLSPPLVKIQARNILDALQQVDPVNNSTYEANYKDFIAEIDLLHADIENIFSGKEGTPFMVFHPSWGYFAKAYGLKQVPIEVEGKDPKPAQLMEIIKYAKVQGIKVIFVQPQFSFRNAEMVAKEINGKVVSIDPLAYNWPENLREVASIFGEVFK